jgi:hypothetical protein
VLLAESYPTSPIFFICVTLNLENRYLYQVVSNQSRLLFWSLNRRNLLLLP